MPASTGCRRPGIPALENPGTPPRAAWPRAMPVSSATYHQHEEVAGTVPATCTGCSRNVPELGEEMNARARGREMGTILAGLKVEREEASGALLRILQG